MRRGKERDGEQRTRKQTEGHKERWDKEGDKKTWRLRVDERQEGRRRLAFLRAWRAKGKEARGNKGGGTTQTCSIKEGTRSGVKERDFLRAEDEKGAIDAARQPRSDIKGDRLRK